MVLALAGFAIPIVAGLTGAVVGAFARRLIAASPDRWQGESRAAIGVLVGLFTGAVPLGAIALVRRHELGYAPVAAVLVYIVVIVLIAGPVPVGGRGARGAAAGVATVVLGMIVAVGVLVAVIFMLQTVIRAIGDEIGETACQGIG